MKKKYLYNGQIMNEADVMDAAKQSNLDINTYIQKAGIKSVNDSYTLSGKSYTAEDILDAANQSKLGFDDYIQKAGFTNTEKKNPSLNSAQNIGASVSPTLSQSKDVVDVKKESQKFEEERGYGIPVVSEAVAKKNTGGRIGDLTPVPKEENNFPASNIYQTPAPQQQPTPQVKDIFNPSDFLINDIEKTGVTINQDVDKGVALADYNATRIKELVNQENGLHQQLLNYHQDKSVQRGDMSLPKLFIAKGYEKELYKDPIVEKLHDEIGSVQEYKNKLSASIAHAASIYAATKTKNPIEAGRLVRTITGDPSVSKELTNEEKSIPISDTQKFYNEKTGLDALETGIEALHQDKSDPTYLSDKEKLNEQRATLLDRHPQFKQQQISNAIAQQIVKDNPNANRSNLWFDVPKAAKELGLSPEEIKAIDYDDIPIQGALEKTFGAAYNGLLGIGAGVARIGGSMIGVDDDKLTNFIQGATVPAERRFEDIRGLQNAPTIVDTDKNSKTFLQNIPNPEKGKYNYTFATISNAIGNGVGSLYGGFVLPAKAFGGVAKAINPALTEAAAADYGLKTTMVLGSYENNYQEAQNIIGSSPQDEGKRHLMALLKGVVDYEVFKPLNKLITPEQTQELGGIIKNSPSLAEINKTALTKWTTKVLDGVKSTVKETGKIGLAQIGGEYAKNIVDHVLGSAKGEKESDKTLEDKIVHGVANLPFSMAVPLGIGEFAKGIKHSSVTQENLYNAGLHPETYLAEANNLLQKEVITQDDYNKKSQVINTVKDIVNSIPEDLNLNHNQKVQYLNSKVREIALQAKADKIDDAALEGYYKKKIEEEVKNRIYIVEGNGKESEFAQKDINAEEPKTEDTKLSQPIEGLDEQGIPVGDNVPVPTDFRGKDNNFLANKEPNFFTPEERATYNELMKTPETEEQAAQMVSDKKIEIKNIKPEEPSSNIDEGKAQNQPQGAVDETVPFSDVSKKEENIDTSNQPVEDVNMKPAIISPTEVKEIQGKEIVPLKEGEGENVPPVEPRKEEKPPTEPPKPPVDTDNKKEDDKEKFSDKGILNRLYKAKNISEETKQGFKEKGLKYKVASQEEARDIAKSVIEEMGFDDAVILAEANKFKNGVNSAIFAESINKLAELEEAATTKAEKDEYAKISAEVMIRFDEFGRTGGQDTSYINYFYKKSPVGVVLKENAKNKEDFEKWAKPKEQSWKDVFDEMMKEPEFEAAVNDKVKLEIQKERTEARKEKKEKVHKAIDDTMAKWIKKLSVKGSEGIQKQGIGAKEIFDAVGFTMKKAYDAGEAISKIVRDAVDYISEKLGHDNWGKDEFSKEWEGKLGKEAAYKESDTRHQARIDFLNKELQRIKDRKNKEPKEKKESTREIPADEQAILHEIEKEQSIWDAEKDTARQAANDYQKLETERNRQLKRVGELNEKIDTLRQGQLPEGKIREYKPDTPEIEALKAEKDALETKVRESIAHEKKLKGLEKELQRLKDRKEKEPKPENKKVISADERLLRDEIESERRGWRIEDNVKRLNDELQRVKDRQEKTTNPTEKRELTDTEKDLVQQIKAEKEVWAKEVEPERKTREALKAAQKSLDEYERRINEKDISPKDNDGAPETPELKDLREKRDAKRKEYEAMKKEMQKPERDAEMMQKRMEKFINRLKGLNQREKEKLIQRVFKTIVEDGALEYPELRKMIAEVIGRGDLTPEESAKMKDLVSKTNAVDEAGKRAREERTQEARKAFRDAEVVASQASKDLNTLLYNRPNITRRLTSMLQLNTLGIAALVNNPIYNIVNQVSLRAPIGLIKTGIDQAIYRGGKLFGKDYRPETNVLSIQVQREFFKKLGLGTRESVRQLVTGLSRMDYTQKEVYGQQIRPVEAMKDLWDFAHGNKNLTKTQVVDKLIQAMPQGWTAEIIARVLNIGDKPQRFAAEGAAASGFAKSLGVKDIDYDLFIDFPREEAYRVYKLRGLSDAEAAKKADYIKDTIIKEGQRSTFQQDNFVNDILTKVFGGQDSGLGGLAKSVIVSPYIKIPSNAYWSYFNIVNPEVAMLQSLIYGTKSYAKEKLGYTRFMGDKDNTSAAKDLNEAKYWLAHAAVGYATRAVIMSLVAAGVYNPSNTADDTKKEREGEQTYEQPGTINVSKLWAIMSGEDPSKVKNGILIQNKWFGHWGSVGNTIARREEEMTPEQRDSREDYWNQMLGLMGESGLKEFGQGVFGNTSSLLTALDRGGVSMQAWGVNTMNMFANIIHPAAFAQVSKAELPYYTKTRADDFFGELKNAMLTRSSWLRKLTGEYPPSKVGIWGDKIEKNTNESVLSTIPFLFGISKANDDNFAQPIYEDYKKTNDVRFFPSAVMPVIKSGGVTTKLTTKEAAELEELVGTERKKLVAPYINDMANIEGFDKPYSQLNEEEKLAALKIFYDAGYANGKFLFLKRHPEYEFEKGQDQLDEEKEESNILKQLRKDTKSKSPAMQ